MGERLKFVNEVGLPLLPFQGGAEAGLQKRDLNMFNGMVWQAHMFGEW